MQFFPPRNMIRNPRCMCSGRGWDRMVSLDFEILFHVIPEPFGQCQVAIGHRWPSFVAGTTSRRRVAKISRSRRGTALSWMLVSKTWRASWRNWRVTGHHGGHGEHGAVARRVA